MFFQEFIQLQLGHSVGGFASHGYIHLKRLTAFSLQPQQISLIFQEISVLRKQFQTMGKKFFRFF